MRFYSRARKPKVWFLAVFALAAAAALFTFHFFGGESRAVWGNAVLSAFFFLSAVSLWVAFVHQLQFCPYSYNTIFFNGFALFILSLAITHLYVTVSCILRPDSFREEQILFILLHSAKNYMLLTTPFLLIFSGALLISNLRLIRHEGFRFVNLLGIMLAFLLVAGETVIGFLDYHSAVSGSSPLLLNMLVNLLAAFYLYFECMIIGSAAADIIAARYLPDHDKTYLIVLGCGLKKDGSPTHLLAGRLDAALRFQEEEVSRTGFRPCFVVSGGQGRDEVQSEAASMSAYLTSHGIAQSEILREDRSVSTEENMRFSREVILKHGTDDRTAFFTTNYHVFRSGIKAEQAGMHAEGVGAPTRWWFWPNAAVREFVGLLTEHKGKQALIALSLVAVYALLTFYAYA